MKIGKAIKIARIKKDLSQEQLASLLEVSSNYISMLENNRRDPSWGMICNFCEKIGISIPMFILLACDSDKNHTIDPMTSTMTQHLMGMWGATKLSNSASDG